MSEENLDSFIEKLPNTCGNTNVSSNDNSCNNPLKCPELTLDELQNFCFYDVNCKINCPANINMNNNLVPEQNDSTIVDTFNGNNNLSAQPEENNKNIFVTSIDAMSDRFHEIATKITYPKVHNAIAKIYNNVIAITPLKDFRQKILYDKDKDVIENIENSPSNSSNGSSTSSSSCCYSLCCLALIGVGVYFYMKNSNPDMLKSYGLAGGLSSDSSAPFSSST
jgi:hypothetical protein